MLAQRWGRELKNEEFERNNKQLGIEVQLLEVVFTA